MNVKDIHEGWCQVNRNVNKYHVTLYRMKDGETGKVWYRINIEDAATAKFARMEFDGKGAKDMALTEYQGIVNGKTPLQYRFQ